MIPKHANFQRSVAAEQVPWESTVNHHPVAGISERTDTVWYAGDLQTRSHPTPFNAHYLRAIPQIIFSLDDRDASLSNNKQTSS